MMLGNHPTSASMLSWNPLCFVDEGTIFTRGWLHTRSDEDLSGSVG